MKRTLILGGIAAVLATAGAVAWAHGDAHGGAKPGQATCVPAEGKTCPAEGKAGHQHGGNMQGRMQGMGGMQGTHAGNPARMAEMHARMHGSTSPASPGTKEEEHKH